MRKNRLKLDENLEVAYYEFSEDVICVEVNHKGRDLGAFCSHRNEFSEWNEADVRQLAKNHAKQFSRHSLKERKQLSTEMEVEYYSHSDDIMCVNVFRKGEEIASFCTDRHSFQEWAEDEKLLGKIIAKQLLN